ncbi:MAG: glycosyltransferase [Betaproteobacteria bacterium]|nr:glycosyltransferase [Betaproteobacteria bacterium]
MVFARAPVPGQCKTRLIPALGAQGAAELHGKLVRRALAAVCEAMPAAVELWCAPDASHPFFAACARDFPISLQSQIGGDLGDRMHNAFEYALGRHDKALLIGSDVPGIDSDYLRAAAAALDAAPAVFGPAEDGGYVLVGLKQPSKEIFDNIDWGGPRVMAQTRDRLIGRGWQAVELATRWDLDRPEDLTRLRL